MHANQSIGQAKQLCPHVLVVPYMYEKYHKISEQVREREIHVQKALQDLRAGGNESEEIVLPHEAEVF